MRVNTLRSTLDAVVAALGDDYRPVESLAQLLAAKEEKVQYYYKDPIIADLLAFSPGTDFTAHPLYTDGTLILQDRSSCFPAHLLAPPPGAWIIDATAAPGNKTTHLAALLLDGGGGGGGVIAFEKDVRRTGVLRDMVRRAGGEGVITIRGNEDFLRCDPLSEPRVTHILLDPSCSGSGIVNRADYALIPLAAQQGKKRKRVATVATADAVEQTAKGRLQELSQFQKAMILHAMLFPSAVKICYSTCSVHAEENEQVVVSVLGSETAKTHGWRVERRAEGTLNDWPRRGVREHCGEGEEGREVAEACVRCRPIEDGGIGFFVVAFVRGAEQVEVEQEEEEEWQGFSDAEQVEAEWQGFSGDSAAPKKRRTA